MYLYAWDGKELTAGDVLEGPQGVVHALAFSPDGKLLAAGDVRSFVFSLPSYVRVWYHFGLNILFSPPERSFSTTSRRRKYVFLTPPQNKSQYYATIKSTFKNN